MSTSDAIDWKVIEATLPAGWRELAAERKLIKRNLAPHIGGKVKDIGQILRLVLYRVAANTGLEAATAAFAAAGILTLSFVMLHKWTKRLGPYLGELVGLMVAEAHAAFAPERWAGYEVIAVDATCVQRPGAKGTTSRVHRALRLTDLRVVAAVVTDHSVGETFRNFVIRAGQLWLGDRAYANPPGVQWIVQHGADLLVRYNRGSLPLYDARGTRIDVLAKLAKLRKPLRPREWKVFVHPATGESIAGRLCAVRLPKEDVQRARERLRKEQGADLTEESLEMAQFVAVLTTVTESKMSTEVILELYRLRWQIELDFKRDKSATGLDKLPNYLPETIESWIYAKLLLHQILRKLADTESAISPCALVASIGPSVERRAA